MEQSNRTKELEIQLQNQLEDLIKPVVDKVEEYIRQGYVQTLYELHNNIKSCLSYIDENKLNNKYLLVYILPDFNNPLSPYSIIDRAKQNLIEDCYYALEDRFNDFNAELLLDETEDINISEYIK